jgi:hypothetical protein
MTAADFDADWKLDLAAVGSDGTLRVLRRYDRQRKRWAARWFKGVKNLKLAQARRVEVKAGRRYRSNLRGRAIALQGGSVHVSGHGTYYLAQWDNSERNAAGCQPGTGL